ncbi:Uncharacterised protein [Trueperella bialowiezensis]|uniref:Protease prsW n=1 Tax=Trueperella bialowiezensis TaxID=312285 RepID=A0A3S4VEM4_9ACTO|nr:Uncharacterised protein [Trueperella bialowiezensis]
MVTTICVVGVLGFLNLLPMLLEGAGASGFVTSALLAAIPLFFTFLFVFYIDRFEPEPLWLYGAALAWGGGIAVVLALAGNTWWEETLAPAVLGATASENDIFRFTASIGAPVIEEFVKGLGIIVIFLFFRKHFNGPVDGIVYGAIIGGGFAFTENILYFTNYHDELGEIFQIRVLDGPLSHDAYTAFFGFFIGFAVYARSKVALLGWLVPAMAGSMFFHFTNNDGLYWMTYETYMFVNNVPVAILIIAMVVYSRNQEIMTVRNGLIPYVNSGWISAAEANMVLSMRERQRAKAWAESAARYLGAPQGEGRKAMNSFQIELVQLAHNRVRHDNLRTLGSNEYLADANDKLAHLQSIRSRFALV